MTRKHFDDRFQTDIEVILKTPRTLKSEVDDMDIHTTLQWHELVPEINSPDFLTHYGQICYIEPCTLFVAVGTERGYVVVFNYHQVIVSILVPQSEQTDGLQETEPYIENRTITALTISPDLSIVVAGYTNGTITIWQLDQKPEIHPFHVISPIDLEQRFSGNVEGHLVVPITNIIITHDNKQIISTDVCGLMFYHYEVKNLLTKNYMTVKVLGKNDVNGIPDDRMKIYDFDVLPIGNCRQITDQIGVVAIITGHMLFVISVFSLNTAHNLFLKTHFKSHIPKDISLDEESTSCVSWFPCIEENGVHNARLAYCWNSCLTVLELDNGSLPNNLLDVMNDLKDKDKSIPTLPISKTSRLWLDDNITAVKWVSGSCICCFTTSKIVMVLYHSKTLEIIGSEPLIYRIPRLTLKLNQQVVSKSYNHSIKLVKGRIVLINNLHHLKVMIGKPISWNDKLIELLKQSNYEKAINLCYFYYGSDNLGQLVVFGLPENPQTRKSLVKPYLTKILNQAIVKYHDCELYFKIINDLGKFELLDLIYENSNESDFFDHLLDYLLSGTISSLSPSVLKNLVLYYQNDGMLLTEILCTIDLTMLDIDSTIQICEKNHLQECLIFIYNHLLHDYKSPFYKLLQNHDKRVYSYLSYILTGRQYPTNKYIEQDLAAKKQLIEILFGHASEVSFVEESSIFPILSSLLKQNSFEMLSTLNEFFEDSILNEESDTVLSRQFIIEALLDICASGEFTDADTCNLSIFIGRNYTKYSQFLRLSDSILSQILQNLINFSNEAVISDCELAIQSLLVQFEPYDEGELIEQLTHKKFYTVLTGLYQKQNKHYKILQMWLNNPEEGDYVNVLAECFKRTKVGVDRINLIGLVRQNFDKFAANNLQKFVGLIDVNERSLHKTVLNMTENGKFKYLEELFKLGSEDSDLVVDYIKLMVKRDINVYDFLTTKLESLQTSQVDELQQFLTDHNQINSLIVILVKKGQYEESLDKLIQSFCVPMDSVSFEITLQIIETYKLKHYWIKLIDKLVQLASKSPQLNQYIYQTFRALSKYETTFIHIFNSFLSNNDQTTLLNIRNILMDILISYSYESEMLKISSNVLNQNIYDKLNLIKADNLTGWSITCKNCVNCNKVLYGDKIDPLQYVIWENVQLKRLNIGGKNINGDSMVFFKCSHGYHSKCLRNLNSDTCILCSQ